MNLTREQMLEEMGLGPLWRLRTAEPAAQMPAQDDARSAPAPDSAPRVSETPAASAPQRPAAPVAVRSAEAVAALGWPELRQSIADCAACGLCRERKQAVPGVGDETADWLFIGEGPGSEEDARGEPFVGQAGKLLDAMLAAIDLERGRNVYIANAVKCRPPGNRTP